MASAHNLLQLLYQSDFEQLDIADAATYNLTKNLTFIPIITAGSETRTLAAPTKAGRFVIFSMATDGGDCVITVTGGYDEAGGTTLTFANVGEAIGLISVRTLTSSGTNTYRWRVLFNDSVAGPSVELGSVALTAITSAAGITLTPTTDTFLANGTGLVVGHTAQETVSDGGGSTDLVPEVQILGTGIADSSLLLGQFNTTNASAPTIALAKGGNAAIASHTIVADDEYLGRIIAFGDDGVDLETPAAEIRFVVDGTPAADQLGGSIEFYTTPDGSTTLTERVRITSAGDLRVANGSGVIVGHTAQVAIGAVTPELQVLGTAPADSTMSLTAWSADAVAPRLYFGKSRSATIGTFSIVTSGDNLGEILAFGDDGVDFNSNANASCAIIFDSAGTIGADRVPGEIRLQTATDAAPSVLTTALTIDKAQTVTCSKGLIAKSTTAAAITGVTTLTAADSGGVFSVAKTSAYAITLPTPAQGLRFKFLILDTGANIVTISDGSAHLYGNICEAGTAPVAIAGSTTLSCASGGSIGDWVEFEGIDATHYLVTGSSIAASDFTVA